MMKNRSKSIEDLDIKPDEDITQQPENFIYSNEPDKFIPIDERNSNDSILPDSLFTMQMEVTSNSEVLEVSENKKALIGMQWPLKRKASSCSIPLNIYICFNFIATNHYISQTH